MAKKVKRVEKPLPQKLPDGMSEQEAKRAGWKTVFTKEGKKWLPPSAVEKATATARKIKAEHLREQRKKKIK